MKQVTFTEVASLREFLESVRADGKSIAVVPTMGALHEGHLSLVREGVSRADVVVVTIFVNPTQFGPHEDFERYPRDLSGDSALAWGAGAQVIFAPPVSEMYPVGEQTRVRVQGVSQGLCGSTRPGHFDGVATVVSKLFNVVGAGVYIFGKKDYQQWRLIERLAKDLLFPVEVIGVPTFREKDGLAMSSRNRFLSTSERQRATSISRGLQATLHSYQGGEKRPERLLEIALKFLEDAKLSPDYVELCNPDTLAKVEVPTDDPYLLAVAARLGETRLIDNIVLSPLTKDIVQLPSDSATRNL